MTPRLYQTTRCVDRKVLLAASTDLDEHVRFATEYAQTKKADCQIKSRAGDRDDPHWRVEFTSLGVAYFAGPHQVAANMTGNPPWFIIVRNLIKGASNASNTD